MKADVEDRVTEHRKRPAVSPSGNERIWREVVSWFWVILAFLLIEGTLVQARVIPSGSMENTVLVGDHLIVSRFGYDAGIPFTRWHVPLWRNPNRQQIIVFRAPLPEEGNPDFIKRCIGTPGDRIKIVAGQVFVNDVPLKEPYAIHYPDALSGPVENYPPSDIDEMGGITTEWEQDFSKHVMNGEIVVPPNDYFMMGDNRDNSTDSRVLSQVGYVPGENIIGKAQIIFFSIRDDTHAWEVWRWPWSVRWDRLFTLVR